MASEFYLGVGPAHEFELTVRKVGWELKDFSRLAQSEELCRGVLSVLRGLAEIKPVERPTFKLVVNYSLSLAEMIAAGRYDSANSDITLDHFPIQGSGQQEVEVELFHFNRVMTSEQVLEEMDKAGYRPAKIEGLLALGAQHPELQRQSPIICLGSRWCAPHGDLNVPCLCEWSGERELSLDWFEYGWRGRCRFLAVRK